MEEGPAVYKVKVACKRSSTNRVSYSLACSETTRHSVTLRLDLNTNVKKAFPSILAGALLSLQEHLMLSCDEANAVPKAPGSTHLYRGPGSGRTWSSGPVPFSRLPRGASAHDTIADGQSGPCFHCILSRRQGHNADLGSSATSVDLEMFSSLAHWIFSCYLLRFFLATI